MAKVYSMTTELDDEACWKKALSSLIFGPDNLTEKVFYNVKHDVMDPVWCLDDASVHFNPMLFFINPYQVSLLNGIFDTIGTVTNCLLLTCPKKKRLMSGLKNYDDLTIHIIKAREGGYERIARGTLWYTMPDERQRFRKLFEDHYSCYIPNYIYKPYLVIRKNYLKQVNDLFMAMKKRIDSDREKRRDALGLTKTPSAIDVLKSEVSQMLNDTNSEMDSVEEVDDIA
jgi:hypothetical protein